MTTKSLTNSDLSVILSCIAIRRFEESRTSPQGGELDNKLTAVQNKIRAILLYRQRLEQKKTAAENASEPEEKWFQK